MSVLDEGDQPVETQIGEILVRWQESREHGIDLKVADLCADCPELAPEVERRIEALRYWDGIAETYSGVLAASPAATQDPPASAAIILNLHDLQFHAQGGLGAVFKAKDQELGRTLAVKLPHAPGVRADDHDLEKRFLREVKVTAALEHPGIVPVYGLGHDAEGRLCYAMRFITGKTLKLAIFDFHKGRKTGRKDKRSPLRRDVEFRALLQRFRSACVTVAYAHSRGFLHRDIKPEHILLGDFDVTLVVDWGLTKPRYDSELTPLPAAVAEQLCPAGDLQTETGIGTLGFASPEQQAGDWDRVGPASDVFSLGATLYALLTGRLPFPGSSGADILARVRDGNVVPPHKLNPNIPRPLEAICLQALARLPGDRYRSAQALADDIERWLADAPVNAYSDPVATRAKRWLERHHVVLFMVLAALAGALGVGAANWHSRNLLDVESRSQAYVSAEKSAREQVLTRRPGWVDVALEQVRRCSQIVTPLRSEVTLRSLAASCLSGVDLRLRSMLTMIPVGDLAFSPDGRMLAVGELSGIKSYRIQIIDLQGGRIVREQKFSTESESQPEGVATLGYSPSGRWLVAGLRNGKILIWDLAAPCSQGQLLIRQPDRLVALGFTPDGKYLVLGLRQGAVLVYDWSPARGWFQAQTTRLSLGLRALEVSRDGTRVLVASKQGIVAYELPTLRGPIPMQLAPGRSSFPGEKLDIAPDDHTLAFSSNASRTLSIGVGGSREVLVDPDLGVAHQNDYCQLAFSPDGTMVVSGSSDNTVKLWDMASMRLLLRLPIFTESCVLPVFHPGGRQLAIGSTEGVALYDLVAGDVASTQANAPGVVSDFAFLEPVVAHGRPELVTVREAAGTTQPDHRILELWDAAAFLPSQTVSIDEWGVHEGQALRLQTTKSGRRVLLHQGSATRVLDLARKTQPQPGSWRDTPAAVCFGRDGRSAWAALRDDSIVCCRLPDLTEKTRWKYTPPTQTRRRVEIASLVAGNTWVVAGTLSGQILILRTDNGQLDHIAHADAPVQVVALSPDESTVICGTQRGDLDVIPIRAMLPSCHVEAHAEMVTVIAFHPSGRYLATDSRSRFVVLWRIGSSSLTEIMRIATPFSHSARAIRFSSDGRYLGILVPNERAVRVWDLVRLRQQLKVLKLDWIDED